MGFPTAAAGLQRASLHSFYQTQIFPSETSSFPLGPCSSALHPIQHPDMTSWQLCEELLMSERALRDSDTLIYFFWFLGNLRCFPSFTRCVYSNHIHIFSISQSHCFIWNCCHWIWNIVVLKQPHAIIQNVNTVVMLPTEGQFSSARYNWYMFLHIDNINIIHECDVRWWQADNLL